MLWTLHGKRSLITLMLFGTLAITRVDSAWDHRMIRIILESLPQTQSGSVELKAVD
jgi:hypothetical protein